MDIVPVFKPATKLPNRTPLTERMAVKMQSGQVTWPEPLLGMTCGGCCYFDRGEYGQLAESSIAKGRGRCRRLAQMKGGKWGAQITESAIACSEFGVEDKDDG